ncbi:hypothetical protein BGZ96_009330 [Linnemannia gamsii]|uniref:Uncharacterized protein n=1 Tax=Linnemannia gamsii TaxID=64522 RepID=A0ABQ7KEE9_9FUNG|nr:hypothetical protein BGZ96_009330 [Linnemannia gamsii]
MEAAAQELNTTFRNAERTWIHSFQENTTGASNLEDCSLHYGEFAFLLAGLKSCLLLQLPTPAMTTAFFHAVIVPQIMHHPAYKVLSAKELGLGVGLECRLITRNVRSPEMSLQGYILLWSSTTVEAHPQAALIQRSIDLLCPPPPSDSAAATTAIVSEQDLAIMLDIPGRLPGSEAEIRAMVEVSYWHQDQDESTAVDSVPVLLTAFAAQPDEIPLIQTHFKRYRDSVRSLFKMTLKLHIRSMADS